MMNRDYIMNKINFKSINFFRVIRVAFERFEQRIALDHCLKFGYNCYKLGIIDTELYEAFVGVCWHAYFKRKENH